MDPDYSYRLLQLVWLKLIIVKGKSIDELEELVTRIEPTAEFIRIMTAEDYRQSLSSNEAYTSAYQLDESEDDE